MFGLEGEGIRIAAIYIGMVLASGLGIWLLRKFSDYFDFGAKLARPALTIVREVVKRVIQNPKKQKSVMKWANLLLTGIEVVENRKGELEEELKDKTKAEKNKIYREMAFDTTEELAQAQNLSKPDVLTKSIANALLESLYNFLPVIKQKEEVTVIDLKDAEE